MSDKLRVLAVIPARGGSKGVANKNILPLRGTPLIVHAINAGHGCPLISRTIVSTDSQEIADVARTHGGEVPFLRPAALATDDAPMAPVIRHALEFVEGEECLKYDMVVLLDPTSPSRSPHQLAAAIRLLEEHPDVDGVVAVSEPTFNPVWVGVTLDGNGNLDRYFPEGIGVTRRQDTKGRFLRINGNFYVWRSDLVRRLERSWLDEGRYLGYEISEAQAFSIDDAYEFRLIDALAATGMVQFPQPPVAITMPATDH